MRLLAAAPLLAAIALHGAVALPLRARALEAAHQYGQARRERQQVQARLAPLVRREAALWKAAQALGAVPASEGGAAPAVRRSVLASLEAAEVSGVRLAVRAASGSGQAATVRLSAEAPLAEAVRLSGELASPSRGLVLEQVRLERGRGRRSGTIRLELQAFAPGVSP